MPEIAAESYITSSTTTTAVENLQTPTLVSPHSNTPPTATAKLEQLKGPPLNAAERAGSEPLDPNVLSKRLKGMEDAGRIRERTPGASPSRKRQRIYGDRLVDYAISLLQNLPVLHADAVRGCYNNPLLVCSTASSVRPLADRIALTGSFRIVMVRTSKPVSAYYMTMHHLLHRRRRRGGRLMESSIFRKVSQFSRLVRALASVQS